MEKPLVSVLMCSFNREKFIAEAIESVLNSTYKNLELIIVDNCSEDTTIEIAKEYEQKDTRVKVYQNESNIGQFPSRNRAAGYAKGKYIKYLDSDDIIYLHGLEIMVCAMEKFPEAGIGFADLYFNGKSFLPLLINCSEAYSIHFFKGAFLFNGPTAAIYKKDFFIENGGFDENFGVVADSAFNLKSAAIKPVVVFNRDLYWWRPHEEQEIIKRRDEFEFLNFRMNQFYLLQNNCPLGNKVRVIALNNIYNNYSRSITRLAFNFNLVKAIKKRKIYKIPFYLIILSCLPSSLRREIQKLDKFL